MWPAVPHTHQWNLRLWGWPHRNNHLGWWTEDRVSLLEIRSQLTIAVWSKWQGWWQRSLRRRVGKWVSLARYEVLWPSWIRIFICHVRFNVFYECLRTHKHMVTDSAGDRWRSIRPFRAKVQVPAISSHGLGNENDTEDCKEKEDNVKIYFWLWRMAINL